MQAFFSCLTDSDVRRSELFKKHRLKSLKKTDLLLEEMTDDAIDAELDRLVGLLGALGRAKVWGRQADADAAADAEAGANARVVYDDDFPTAAPADWRAQADAFLAAHPHMAADPGYRRCLQHLGGVTVGRIAIWFQLSIYGFDPDEWPFLPQKEVQMTDRPGFDSFADIHYKISLDAPGPPPRVFAFSTSAPGIFHAEGDGPYAWYCDNFLGWLHRVVDARAFLPEDGH